MWRAVEKITGRKVDRTAVDSRADLHTFHLHGDNVKILRGLDVCKYDVIDLDDYGVPYDQIKEVFRQKFKGWVFVTFIQSVYGALPTKMLVDVGFSEEMIKKSPALINRRGWDHFKLWLALNGVHKIWHRSKGRKHYLCFHLC